MPYSDSEEIIYYFQEKINSLRQEIETIKDQQPQNVLTKENAVEQLLEDEDSPFLAALTNRVQSTGTTTTQLDLKQINNKLDAHNYNIKQNYWMALASLALNALLLGCVILLLIRSHRSRKQATEQKSELEELTKRFEEQSKSNSNQKIDIASLKSRVESLRLPPMPTPIPTPIPMPTPIPNTYPQSIVFAEINIQTLLNQHPDLWNGNVFLQLHKLYGTSVEFRRLNTYRVNARGPGDMTSTPFTLTGDGNPANPLIGIQSGINIALFPNIRNVALTTAFSGATDGFTQVVYAARAKVGTDGTITFDQNNSKGRLA